jgi:hypothetical protein
MNVWLNLEKNYKCQKSSSSNVAKYFVLLYSNILVFTWK